MALFKQPMSWAGGTIGLMRAVCQDGKEKELRNMFASCQSYHKTSVPKQRSNVRGYSLLSKTYPLLRAYLCHITVCAERMRLPRCSPGFRQAWKHHKSSFTSGRSKPGQSLKHFWNPVNLGPLLASTSDRKQKTARNKSSTFSVIISEINCLKLLGDIVLYTGEQALVTWMNFI